jgi:hypothetical protein
MTLYIIAALLVISAIAKAVQDKIQFHFDKSIFRFLPHSWWKPSVSNKNKNTWSKNQFITWCLKTWLVAITDAWHFFGFLRDFSLFLCITVASGNWWWMFGYIGLRLVFHIFFTYIFKA